MSAIPRRHRLRVALRALWIAALLTPVPAFSRATIEEMSELSLEDLLNMDIVSASKRAERYADVAAAVFIVTADDIRASGATSVPEALRTVPGLSVMRIDANKWAISARGFSGLYANKLLVLVDGRSVFSPLFAGVYWDTEQVALQEVERIEVVRGPGGALWGANAVNGVINIITRSSRASESRAEAEAGSQTLRAADFLRWAGSVTGGPSYRAYGRFTDRGDLMAERGAALTDEWRDGQAGLRMDWDHAAHGATTIQADYHRGQVARTLAFLDPTTLSYRTKQSDGALEGGNVLARWVRNPSSGRGSNVLAYWDRIFRDAGIYDETTDNVSLEAQQLLPLFGTNAVTVGGGVRRTVDDVRPTEYVLAALVERRATELWNVFVQDEQSFLDGNLRFVAGSKLEHSSLTGYEFQPNARVSWAPRAHQLVWAAVSRAIATPSRYSWDMQFNLGLYDQGPMPMIVRIEPNDTLASETMTGYELGYRHQLGEAAALDVALFENRYADLSVLIPDAMPTFDPTAAIPHLTLSQRWFNAATSTTRGAEALVDIRGVPFADRVQLGYSWLRQDYRLSAAAEGQLGQSLSSPESDPRHLAFLNLRIPVGDRVAANTSVRWLSATVQRTEDPVTRQVAHTDVDPYATLDANVQWTVSPTLDLQLIGQNLLERDQPEFADYAFGDPASGVRRTFYVRVGWKPW